MNETALGSAIPSNRSPFWAGANFAKVVLCLALCIAYANSLPGAFVFDDLESIPENPSIRNIERLDSVLSPPHQSTVAGRPVLNFSLAINYAVDGLRVQGYHIMNIGIHLLAALALFGILRRTLELPRLASRYGRASIPLAFAVSLLWGLHPIQTGSVTYIIQRAESMMGLFYLLTLYCTIRAAEGAQPLRWTLCAIGSCALGMGTKEAMASAPLVVMLYDRIYLSSTWRDVLRKRGILYAGLAATWIILLVTMISAASRGGTVGFGMAVAWWQYAGTQFGVILHYLRLVFWPSPLILDYGWPIAEQASRIVLPAIPILGLLGLTVWALRRHATLGFLGAAFFLILAPTSSIVPIRDAAFEHRMYLPLAAIVTLLVLGAYALLTRGGPLAAAQDPAAAAGRPDPDISQAGFPAAARSAVPRILVATAVIAIVFIGLTHLRNRDYRTEVSIWRDTIEKRPDNWRAHDVLGIAYARIENYQEAVESHTAALRLKPDSAITYYNRGKTYLELGLKIKQRQAEGKAPADMDLTGLFQLAIDDFSSSIRLDRQGDTYNNRAVADFQIGEYARAMADVDSSRMAGFQPHPRFVQFIEEALARQAADSVSSGNK